MKAIRDLTINEEARKQGYRNWIQWNMIRRGITLRPDWEHPKGRVVASVSKGRWFIKCPDKSCNVGQGAVEGHQLHFCFDCLNVGNDFKPYHVDWGDIGLTQELLGVRKDYRQRNYEPHLGETLKHLELENERLVDGIYYA